VHPGRSGLIYAGLGAYIYTLFLMISRLNSSALTGKFLLISALRAAIAMVIGLAIGETRVLVGSLSPNQAHGVYFFVGLFPGWVMAALRQKAKEILQPREDG